MRKIAQTLLSAAAFASVAWMARPAEACSLRSNQPLVLDPQAQASDSAPPSVPTAAVESITSGKGPVRDSSGCGESASSCDDLGRISLTVSATDDQTAAASLGFQVELVAGNLPAGLTLPTGAVLLLGQYLFLHWIDGASDDQEAISFSLAIRAVDLAGNVGPPVTVQVSDPGSGGCSVAARRVGWSWPASVLAVLLAARLLRRRRSAGISSLHLAMDLRPKTDYLDGPPLAP
jgi:hypothetical protein